MRLLLVTILLLVACGCSFNAQSKPERVAKNLSVGKTALVSIAETADTLCTNGTLDQTDCDLASDLYVKSQAGYVVAVDALAVAVAADTDDAWTGFFAASEHFREGLSNLIIFIGSFQKGAE